MIAPARRAAAMLANDRPDGDLVLVALLPHGAEFAAQISRELGIPHALDAMVLAPFEGSADGCVRVLREPGTAVAGRHVVVVDAVADTGLTLRFAVGRLEASGAASVEACVLVDRRARRLVEDLPLRSWSEP